MQKTIKILFDVTDPQYREQFYCLNETVRELQVPVMYKSVVNDFIQNWKSIFEIYNIPPDVVYVKYVGERYIFE